MEDKSSNGVTPSTVTHLLHALDGGERGAFSRLVELTYGDMHRLASVRLGPRPDHRLAAEGLGPTALAHETFERLHKQREIAQSREHFFALATRMMMRVLIDHRRRVRAKRRGGGAAIGALGNAAEIPSPGVGDRMEVSELMQSGLLQLHRVDPRKAEVVTLHAVCGMSLERAAELVGISRATAERDWAFAKAWLARWAEEGQA